MNDRERGGSVSGGIGGSKDVRFRQRKVEGWRIQGGSYFSVDYTISVGVQWFENGRR